MHSLLQETGLWIHAPLFTIGKSTVTPYGLVGFLLLFLVIILAERLFRRVVLRRFLARTQMDASLRFAVERFVGYLLVALGLYISLQAVGLYISLQAVGLDLGSLAVVAGAIGVGLGFGLQNIFSNFVSGIIILAERPIAIGDRVEVGGVAGQVSSINLRSTTVITNDNISMIVPNSQFISETVTNWSHGAPQVRLRIPIGVAYGTDLEKLKAALLSVAREHPHVLTEPEPYIFFENFGDSSLNFELGVWTREMVRSPRKMRSELNFAIDRKLRQAGIEIPFPQRDLHIRSGLPVAPHNGDTSNPT